MSNQDIPPSTQKPAPTLASRGIQPRFGELVQSCRKLVMNRLAEQLTGVFAQVDDTLFEYAEKAENNQVQNLFFDSMREIRKQRPQIERSYHQKISQNFSDFLDGKLKPVPSTAELDAEQLALVQNEEYEESLLIASMVNQVKSRCAQQLFALEQRLALLNNGQQLGEENNPFGPQMIALAFRQALAPSPLQLQIKAILYSLFDKHVMLSLDTVYSALNQRLVDAGVLPNLKYAAQRTTNPERPGRTESAPDAGEARPGDGGPQATAPPSTHAPHSSAPAQPLDLDGPPPGNPTALLEGLTALLGKHRQRDIDAPLLGGTRSIASYAPRNATSTYSASDLLEALNRMQRQSADELAQRLQRPQQVGSLKADLQRQLEVFSQRPGQQKLSDQETDVIDLVGMLFDFILDDSCLNDSYKTLLSHLHTPYLKVALQDKALFTQHQHPARRLLNSMAKAGVLYGGETNEHALLAKMQWVVERVVSADNNTPLLFQALLEQFDQYTATLKHKVELREHRAVEAAKGRDKLLGARQQALDVIARCLNQRQTPGIIRNFLELTWADVLVFVLLRHGESSSEWQRACEVAEQLAWSGTPLDESGRQQLQALRMTLLDDLRKGLQLLGGYHEDGIRRLLQDLVACQYAAQAKQPQLADTFTPQLAPSTLGAMLGEDAMLASLAPHESGLSARAQTFAKELMQIEFGTWFEFLMDNQPLLLKLSWFSPTTRNYMFVDHSGQRAAIKPLTQLATEMEQGIARIVPPENDAPLVDRALSAIYRVLQRVAGRTSKTH
ncbi:DUF1631 domain-containing protein [Pseudomonas sp.]|uniref:DUF1631 domain-containing protein n=1 Tax=Pseudomonas sp. TaxID=306 RepID=UPI00299E617D|nr:DUF1631 domain-containing protein [Pseudomonas sp.]MDX1367446.1 DUF1631 domain-containing protein [Pseudomonas sp.]